MCIMRMLTKWELQGSFSYFSSINSSHKIEEVLCFFVFSFFLSFLFLMFKMCLFISKKLADVCVFLISILLTVLAVQNNTEYFKSAKTVPFCWGKKCFKPDNRTENMYF